MLPSLPPIRGRRAEARGIAREDAEAGYVDDRLAASHATGDAGTGRWAPLLHGRGECASATRGTRRGEHMRRTGAASGRGREAGRPSASLADR